MALAIDASTPALATANSGDTATTASFTPPAGAVLCAVAWHDTASGNTTNSSAITDSQGLTWSIQATRAKPDSGAQNGHVQVSTAVVASSTAMTVTSTAINTGGSHAAGVYVLVMTGCDTTTPIDVIAEGSNTGGAVSLALPATITDLAWGFLANGDWNVAAAPTAGTNQTAILSTGIGAGPDNRIYLGRQNSTTSPAGTVITMSTATPTSGNTNNSIGWAFRPSAGGSSTSANAENAAGTGTANVATVDIQASAGAAAAAGAALDAVAAAAVNAEASAGTGAANAATVSVAGQAEGPAGAGTAYDASAAGAAGAENAAGAGTAFDATVSTAAQTSANAENAAGVGAASDAAAAVGASAGAAAGSAAAFDAATSLAPAAGAAAASGAAFDAMVAVAAAAGAAVGAGEAVQATTTGAGVVRDLHLTVGPPEPAWTARPPDGGWSAGRPDGAWTTRPPEA